MKDTNYAIYDPETGELSIGRDVPGLASHGAAVSVGTFDNEEHALDYAKRRGCSLFNDKKIP